MQHYHQMQSVFVFFPFDIFHISSVYSKQHAVDCINEAVCIVEFDLNWLFFFRIAAEIEQMLVKICDRINDSELIQACDHVLVQPIYR